MTVSRPAAVRWRNVGIAAIIVGYGLFFVGYIGVADSHKDNPAWFGPLLAIACLLFFGGPVCLVLSVRAISRHDRGGAEEAR